MEKKKRVLIVNTTPFGPGGITKVIMSYYDAICDECFMFDVVAINEQMPEQYRQAFEDKGGQVFCLARRKNILGYFFSLLRVCIRGKYDAIHVHGNSATMAVELLAASLGGTRKRIAHCHTSACEHVRAHKMLMPLFSRLYNQALACSEDAGNWIFGKGNFTVLNNAVDAKQYAFSPMLRQQYRQQLGISDSTLVLGHVGYFQASKNHAMLVKLMEQLAPKMDVKLILVGVGQLMEQIRQQVSDLDLSDRVLFLGARSDVIGLLQAMDVFLFPSIWEGLGIALLEAEMSGLHCIASEGVPQVTNLSGQVAYLPLEPVEAWVDRVAQLPDGSCRAEQSMQTIAAATQMGYDIASQAQKLERLY